MNTFPTDPKPRIGSKDTTIIPIVKSESDGNYTRVRRIATRSREKFELNYNVITFSEFDILKSFFVANQGFPFTFTHPATSVAYTCIFSQEELEKNYIDSKFINTKIILEEV